MGGQKTVDLVKLKEIAAIFFRLGCISFGGPVAHIALLEDEMVRKHQWMDRQHFLDLVGATNLIPGPNSTEMTMHCGYERAGFMGLVVAGVFFIFPAVLISAIFAWLYIKYGQLPQVQPFLYGIKPVVLVIIISAILKLGRKAFKSRELMVLAMLVVVVCLLGMNEIFALLVAGLLSLIYYYFTYSKGNHSLSIWIALVLPFKYDPMVIADLGLWRIFFIFLKIGALLYGSGYVLFAYLDAELVAHGWFTRQQLMDAVAVGQMTPGPVLSTATFIGYQLGGWTGALVATIGIFLPSFTLVYLLNPLVPKMRSSKIFAYFLDAINAASVAVMVSVLVDMTTETLLDWQALVITILAIFFSFGPWKFSSLDLVLGGSALGYLLYALF